MEKLYPVLIGFVRAANGIKGPGELARLEEDETAALLKEGTIGKAVEDPPSADGKAAETPPPAALAAPESILETGDAGELLGKVAAALDSGAAETPPPADHLDPLGLGFEPAAKVVTKGAKTPKG